MAKIAIDPGHGGVSDLLGSSASGAVGPAGTLEKQLTLDVAMRLAPKLQASGHQVWLTREGDNNLSASDRAEVGKRHAVDAFVSIHFGAAKRPLQGTEVLVRPPTPSGTLDARSAALAGALRRELVEQLGLSDLGLRSGPWAILNARLHDEATARCLVEVSFIHDAAEEERLSDAAYREGIATALARGIEQGLAGQRTGARMRGRAVGGRPAYGRAQRSFGFSPRYGQTDWCAIRHGIIRSAEEMQGAWLDPNGTMLQESHASVLPHLEAFWRDGLADADFADRAAEAAADTRPWSGAFISWVVRNGGVTDGQGFDFSGRHMTYIAQAVRNAMNADLTRPFWFREPSEPIEPGDMVCLNRPNAQGTMSTHTYDGLVRRFWGEHGENESETNTTGRSHSDIVVAFVEDGGTRYIEVTGGNRRDRMSGLRHTVGSQRFEIDNNNVLVDPAGENIFGIIRLEQCRDQGDPPPWATPSHGLARGKALESRGGDEGVYWRPGEERDDYAQAQGLPVRGMALPAGFRLGAWIDVGGRNLGSNLNEHVARLHALGINDACVMFNGHNDSSFGFGTASKARIRALAPLLQSAGIGLTLTSWLRPEQAFIDALVAELPDFAREVGARQIEFDAEEAWSRRTVRGYSSHADAADALFDQLDGLRDMGIEVGITPQVDPMTGSKLQRLVQRAHFVVPQAYSAMRSSWSDARKRSHAVGATYGPVGIQRRAVSRLQSALGTSTGTLPMIMGLAAYGRGNWNGHSAAEIMQMELDETLSLAAAHGIQGVRYWSWKWIAGQNGEGGRPANRYSASFFESLP